MQSLDINKYTNCASIVLRVFVELSIDTYLETFQLLGEQAISAANSGKPLHEKVILVKNNMVARKVMDEATSKGIRVMTKKKTLYAVLRHFMLMYIIIFLQQYQQI